MARKEFSTLTEQMFYILLVLQKPHHGYEIMQQIDRMTLGRIKIGAGTLYSLLARFEDEKFITRVEDDGRKKTYQISQEGHQILQIEVQRLQVMIHDYRKEMDV